MSNMYGRPPTGSMANRPSSRAGAGAAGGGGAGGGTSWGRPGVTAGPGAPPRTAVRGMGVGGAGAAGGMGTARPTTNMRQGGLQIPDRPMTHQGLTGLPHPPPTLSSGRQIHDPSYFQHLLRTRLSLLQREISNLHNLHATLAKESAHTAQFEKRADLLVEELKALQGDLGDLNMLVEQIHAEVDLEELERRVGVVKGKNERENSVLESVFEERRQRDQSVADLQAQITALHAQSSHLLASLPPAQQAHHASLLASISNHQLTITQHQTTLATLNRTTEDLKRDVGRDERRVRAVGVMQRLDVARRKKAELEEELRKLDGGEAEGDERGRLLQQVKQDNQETSAMDRKIADLEAQSSSLKLQLSQLDLSLDSLQSDKKAKYDELVKRDKDMTTFIEASEAKKAAAQTRNVATEQKIVQLLEEIKGLAKHEMTTSAPGAEMPTPGALNDLQGDLKMKEQEMRNAETTMEALVQERDRRLQDYEKVLALESKMSLELPHLNNQLSTLQTSLLAISDLETVRTQLETRRQELQTAAADLAAFKKNVRDRVEAVGLTAEAKRAHLVESETGAVLSGMEQRIRYAEGTNFHLKEYISSKLAESDYAPVKTEVIGLMDEINRGVIKILGGAATAAR